MGVACFGVQITGVLQLWGVLRLFLVVLGVGARAPHLKNGRDSQKAVSPPSSTKKININFGWGGVWGCGG